MLEPFDHLEDCFVAVCALQMSLYQLILEKRYNMEVISRYVASCHEEGSPGAASHVKVPYLKLEASFLLSKCTFDVIARRVALNIAADVDFAEIGGAVDHASLITLLISALG